MVCLVLWIFQNWQKQEPRLYFISLNQIERIADDGIRTQHYDDARDAHVDAHVHDASRLCLRPVSFLIQFDCFQNFSTGKPKQASRFYLYRKEVLKWKKYSITTDNGCSGIPAGQRIECEYINVVKVDHPSVRKPDRNETNLLNTYLRRSVMKYSNKLFCFPSWMAWS